jgi:hypothetical protein
MLGNHFTTRLPLASHLRHGEVECHTVSQWRSWLVEGQRLGWSHTSPWLPVLISWLCHLQVLEDWEGFQGMSGIMEKAAWLTSSVSQGGVPGNVFFLTWWQVSHSTRNWANQPQDLWVSWELGSLWIWKAGTVPVPSRSYPQTPQTEKVGNWGASSICPDSSALFCQWPWFS